MKLTCVLVVLLLVLPFGDLITTSNTEDNKRGATPWQNSLKARGVCSTPEGSCVHNGCICQNAPCCHPSGCNWANVCPGFLWDKN
uniref:Mu-conotoxin-like Cal 12.2a n=1 Tax=Californiconus californicus TaxID=1736779 RepID=COCA_CONCL|nr:RecName: Full=Mu-conotoxin-like Cal 12.2a; AltName: Full=Conotoxin CalTx 12.2.1A; AltName: Full=Conotoxin Cl12a; Flags: Precursor [Californiconus californicus]ABR92966.1 conotoxin CalTx 12.2.1A [Californiconus californicus]